MDWRLLEVADRPGGRVRTDTVGEFALDRGFQVLLTAYPEAQAALDYPSLRLGAFEPGALVRVSGRFHQVSDPSRRPGRALRTVRAPVGSLTDKVRVARLRRLAHRDEPFSVADRTTADELAALGFSPLMVERLLRPLFGGIQLDPLLTTSARMFRFVLRMLTDGEAALPAGGMQAIPDQLVAALPAQRVTYRTAVAALSGRDATLASSDRVHARRAVVVATDAPAAASILHDIGDPGSRSVATVYLVAERPPVEEPLLVLDGEARGPVNHLCVPSQVAGGYAPDGAALISASILDDRGLGDDALVEAVRDQLSGWFGPGVRAWRHLRTYRIPHAQPDQSPPRLSPPERDVRLGGGRYVCGDHRDNASINGALVSGRRAAEAVLDDLAG